MAFPQIARRPDLPRPTLLSSDRLVAGALGLVAAGLAILIAHDIFFPPATTVAAVRTSTVNTGSVRSAVTATGTLVPATQQNLGFRSGGALTEVDVRVGDRVKAGQLLAKVDEGPLQLALTQAQAQLASAQANLSNTLNGTALTQALHTLQQAQQTFNDTLNQVNQTNANDQNTVNADQNAVNGDQNQQNADQAGYWYTQYQPTLTNYQSQLNAGQAEYRSQGCNAYTIYPSAPAPSCYDAVTNISTAQAGINCLQGNGLSCSAAAQQIAMASKAVAADQARVAADNTKLAADNSKLGLDQQTGQRSINQAANSITNARDSYNNQAVNRPGTLAQGNAAVASAEAAVNTAQTNLNGSALTAPTDGVIASVTGQVGDTVGAISGSSGAEAPGTTAPLPSSSGSTTSSGTGVSAFMVLMADRGYQAVVSFAESDAANVQANQSGTLTFDAVSGLSIPVHVLAVAAAPTISSNVVNYYVTLTLDSLDNRLKSGFTANASIVTAIASNVLNVPNSAVTRLGGTSFVNILVKGKPMRTRIQTGIVGDTTTEVTSGLNPGDKVVLPQLRTTTGTTTTRGAGGGGGGGGGVVRGIGGG